MIHFKRIHWPRLFLLAVAGVGLAVAAAPGEATTARFVNEGATKVGAPAWYFVVAEVQDPYAGAIQAPQVQPPGTRHVAALVEVIIESGQSLNFTPLDIRVRDEVAVEYRGGGAVDAEPAINPRNLNPGERSRGWVWLIVPADSSLVEIVYYGPPAQFRVPLPL